MGESSSTLSGSKVLVFACILAFLNSAINGYDLSNFGGVIVLPAFWLKFADGYVDEKGAPDFEPFLKGTLFAILMAGSILGTFLSGPLQNLLGRVRGMSVGSAIIIVGTAFQVFSGSITVFMIGRFLIGLGISFVTSAAPTYVVEIAHPDWRGRATAFYNTGWNVGAVPGSFLLFAVSYMTGDKTWQIPCLIQAVLSGAVFIGCFFIPESPRWLVAQGRHEEARQFFIKYQANGDESSPLVDGQMAEIDAGIGEEKAAQTFAAFFTTPANRQRLVILICVAFFSQYAGDWVAGMFLPSVTKYFLPEADVKLTLFFNAALNSVGAVAGFYGASLADKVNRRSMLFYGTCIFAVCYAGIIGNLYIFNATEPQEVLFGYAAFGILILFKIAYSMCWTPLNALYAVETLDYNGRATGMAFCQFWVNMANLFQSYVLSYGFNAFDFEFLWFFLVFNAFAAVVIYIKFPEYKGCSLEEIQAFFETSDPVKASLDFAKRPADIETKSKK